MDASLFRLELVLYGFRNDTIKSPLYSSVTDLWTLCWPRSRHCTRLSSKHSVVCLPDVEREKRILELPFRVAASLCSFPSCHRQRNCRPFYSQSYHGEATKQLASIGMPTVDRQLHTRPIFWPKLLRIEKKIGAYVTHDSQSLRHNYANQVTRCDAKFTKNKFGYTSDSFVGQAFRNQPSCAHYPFTSWRNHRILQKLVLLIYNSYYALFMHKKKLR